MFLAATKAQNSCVVFSFSISVHLLFCACLPIDRWLEIEMRQSEKNKVVIHVECIHDPTFEIANYRPAGTEHVKELVL